MSDFWFSSIEERAQARATITSVEELCLWFQANGVRKSETGAVEDIAKQAVKERGLKYNRNAGYRIEGSFLEAVRCFVHEPTDANARQVLTWPMSG